MQPLPFPHLRRHRVAFVLSGGASLGAIQVGMLQALLEHGIRPDVIVGTSAGALNGAWSAAGYSAEGLRELERIWLALRRGRVFPVSPRTAMAGLIGKRESLISPHGVDAFIRQHLSFELLEDAPIPLHVVATDISDGSEVVLSSGPAHRALMASVAIPAIFPPVELDGRSLVDGGIANNTPISVAASLGADELYVLPTGLSRGIKAVPRSALGLILQSAMLMASQRLAVDIQHYQRKVKLHTLLLPPAIRPSPVDFSRSADLISASRDTAGRWLRDMASAPTRAWSPRRVPGRDRERVGSVGTER